MLYSRGESSLARFFGVPISPVLFAGLRPAAKEEGVCWCGGTAATPAHTFLLSDPHAGREQIMLHR